MKRILLLLLLVVPFLAKAQKIPLSTQCCSGQGVKNTIFNYQAGGLALPKYSTPPTKYGTDPITGDTIREAAYIDANTGNVMALKKDGSYQKLVNYDSLISGFYTKQQTDSVISFIYTQSKHYTDSVVLNQVTNSQFGGSVVPTSNPGPTVNTYYFATQAGTYTNMGGVVVSSNSFAVISYKATGAAWSISQTPLILTTDYVNKLTDIGKVVGKNLLNLDKLKNTAISSGGTLSGSSPDTKTADSILVKPNQQYTIWGYGSGTLSGTHRGAWIRAGGALTVFTMTVTGAKTTIVTSPSDALYVRLNIKTAGDPVGQYDSLMLEEGSRTSFEKYQLSIVSIAGDTIKNANKNVYSQTETNALVTGNISRSNNSIYVLKSGNDIYIRGIYNDTADIVRHVQLTVASITANQTFDYITAKVISFRAGNTIAEYEAGATLAGSSDDVAPLTTVRYGNLGEGHGLSCPVATCPSHGKDATDLGSLYTDALGIDYYLERIIDANTLLFVCRPYSLPGVYDSVMKQTIQTGTLTYKSGGTHISNITCTAQAPTQQYPVTFNVKQSLYIDGKLITSDGGYYCKIFTVSSSEDYVHPQTLNFSTQPFAFNNGQSFLRRSNNYNFGQNGSSSNTISYSYKLINGNHGIQMQKNMGLQTRRPTPTTPTPKQLSWATGQCKPTSPFDYSSPLDVTNDLASTVDVDSSKRVNHNNPISGSIFILADAGGNYKHGYIMGFLNSPSRIDMPFDWQFANTGKQYAYAQSSSTGSFITDTSVFSYTTYQAYCDMTQTGDATTVFPIPISPTEDYLRIDVNGSKTKGMAKTQPQYYGRSFEIVEKSPTMNVLQSIISPDGILFTNTGTNDYVILKCK